MELTPKVFRDVQFREKLRGGYHPEDVDEFLEQAALGVEALQDKLRQATERAQRAEQSATEATATDEALKRMLLMAQRTADQAVSEAREEAEKMTTEARAQAESTLADAEERGRRAYESALAEGRANMQKAEEELHKALEEVEALRAWVDLHKGHLLSVLDDARNLVENAGLLSEPPPVTTRGPEPSDQPREQQSVLANPAGPASEAGEGAQGPVSPDQLPTGEWGPRSLEGVALQASAPVADAATGPDQPGEANPEGQVGAPRHALSEDTGLGMDERALDTFFSDQDLGDDRGPSRFRRRQ
jgi:DivIVA domain-containing protein